MRTSIGALFALLLISISCRAQSQWEQIPGPAGGLINAIATAGAGHVIAGTTSGVYVSTDQGETWTLSGLKGGVIASLLAHGDFLMALTTGNLLYQSTNGGTTWTSWHGSLIGTPQTAATASALFVLFTDGAGPVNHLYRSTDGGATWSEERSIYGITSSIHHFTGGESSLLAFTNDGILQSTDDGRSWVPTTAAGTSLRGVATIGRFSMAIYQAGGLLNDGSVGRWDRFDGPPDAPDLQALGTTKRGFMAVTPLGMYTLDTGSTSWKRASASMTSLHITGFAHDGNVLFCGTEDGVFRSTDDGSTWSKSSSGINYETVRTMLRSGGRVLAATQHGIAYTDDAGITWRTTLPGVMVGTLTSDGMYLYAGTLDSGAFRSGDNGTHWEPIGTEVLSSAPRRIRAMVALDSRVIVEIDRGLFASTDHGSSWTAIDTLMQWSSLNGAGFAVAHDTIFLASSGMTGQNSPYGTVRKSTDGGRTWQWTALAGSDSVTAIATDGSTIWIVKERDLYSSTDGGEHWAGLPEGRGFEPIRRLAYAGGRLYAASDYGIYYSTTGGMTWVSFSQGLPNTALGVSMKPITAFLPGDDTLPYFLGTWRSGLWRRSQSLSEVPRTSMEPDDALTLTIAPNPIAETGALSLRTAASRNVTATLTDEAGRACAKLFEGRLDAGAHAIPIRTDGLPCGLYRCVIRAGGITTSAPLIITR